MYLNEQIVEVADLILPKKIFAVASTVLFLAAFIAPLHHAESIDYHHEHTTCEVCLLILNLQGVDIAAHAITPSIDFIEFELSVHVTVQYFSAFDYAVAHPRGPPSCLKV